MTAVALEMVQDEQEYSPLRTGASAAAQECVLLIEDSQEAMWLVRYAIEEYGNGSYRLEWATTLSEGVKRILAGGIDIVLLDLGLPDSSGPESYAWVREVVAKTPVLVLTGNTCEETEFAVCASGAEGYLVKEQISGLRLMDAIRMAIRTNKQVKRRDQFALPRLFKTRFRLC
jgi:DNA-binding response OmpR family regulator